MAVQTFSKSTSAYHGPDPLEAAGQLEFIKNLINTKECGVANFCKVAPIWILRKVIKEPEFAKYWETRKERWNKRLVPFALNRGQQNIEMELALNNIYLKFRQGGFTTWHVIRRLLLPALLEPGSSGLLISQTRAMGAQHFSILQRALRLMFYKNPFNFRDPDNAAAHAVHQHLLHTQYSARHEVVFDMLDSRVLVDTAENTEVGQGLPGVNHLVATEVARWPHNPEETMANVTESVVPGGTKDIESTANGMGGYFFEEYQRAKNGESEYRAHFFPWPYAEEYVLNDKDAKDYITSKEELTEKERELQKLFDLTLGQIAWRRKSVIRLRHNFAEKYPEDDATAFLVSGGGFFDRGLVQERLIWVRANVKPTDIGMDGNYVQFHKAKGNRRYVLHADVALGKQVSLNQTDFSYFTVLDEDTGQQMCRFQAQIVPEDFAYIIDQIGRVYNNAIVSVENNPGGGGTTVLMTLERDLRYTNLYRHKQYNVNTEKVFYELGLSTTPKTRPIMLNRLARAIRENVTLFSDEILLTECLTFVRDEKGNPAAAEGCHDDAVLGAAGAEYVRLVRTGWIDPIVMKSEKYGEDEEEQ